MKDNFGLWLGLAFIVGVILGQTVDNMPLGIGLSLAIGTGIGMGFESYDKRDD
ncbi:MULTISPECIES: glycine zipper family protein [Aerococcus]|uniref:Glycine zipper family protein n=1 Tax=Aerococcus sanguinicola TaxID=119206 RepID=A0A5N1GQ29_9LACT|nr:MULTISPECIES: glycine zipper family protein [Aerococcus]KAA9300820.1 glycine zipper family protein [Aerococcus sanguinicola]MDK6369391.1 glycine zipper family protein [Aerococcus sp. UMB9870]MDK6679893.1 glycine zipper family protein [Aerococcus sp. UMB8608]MDK6686746.1 glycine zipper family protein [Aerococcus sp. UMB8623]MDK6939815.1 glycine zipper family protein [Aerococcus sp. UMB8487]